MGVLDPDAACDLESGDSAVPGLQDEADLVAGLDAEVRRRDPQTKRPGLVSRFSSALIASRISGTCWNSSTSTGRAGDEAWVRARSRPRVRPVQIKHQSAELPAKPGKQRAFPHCAQPGEGSRPVPRPRTKDGFK